MKIKKLVMHNFGVYASTNILEFHGEKPIVLVGGMNGRGKTTILEGILLSLYGANSFAYKESKYSSYSQYLKSFINKADGTLETYIEIEFHMDETDEVYCVRRDWNGKKQRVKEKILVKRNGEDNSFLTENWPMFVENILPSALSSFFFFDGEKIAELAVEDTSEQMKESIKAMLGISVLDVLQGDISEIIKKISKNNADNVELQKLEEVRIKKEKAEKALNDADINIENERCNLENLQINLEDLNQKYIIRGGCVLEQKNTLINQRSELVASINNSQEHLTDVAAGELPLLLVKDLLYDIQNVSEKEHESKINKQTIEKIDTFYENYEGKSKEVHEFISFVKSEIDSTSKEEVYKLSDQSIYQIENLTSKGLEQSKNKAQELFASRNDSIKKLDEIENSLSLDIDENELKRLLEEIRAKEREISTKQYEIEQLEKERTNLNGAFIMAESEYSRASENVLSVLESIDSDERTVKYAQMAIEIIKRYRVRLQERKTDILAQTMTDCYKRLANKKNFVKQIKIDSENLDIHYIDYLGEEVTKERLSAGEKQLMVISLLWALAICSKKKLPVIIDTPLSRLDSYHREALIKTYFPNASDQTIILSTDSEIDEKAYQLIKDEIGDAFTLKYDDATKTTTIENGYFGFGGIKS